MQTHLLPATLLFRPNHGTSGHQPEAACFRGTATAGMADLVDNQPTLSIAAANSMTDATTGGMGKVLLRI